MNTIKGLYLKLNIKLDEELIFVNIEKYDIKKFDDVIDKSY